MNSSKINFPLPSGSSNGIKWRFVAPALYMIGSTSILGVMINNFISIFAQNIDAISSIAIMTMVYSVMVTSFAPIGGYFGDTYGRRNMALISVLILIVGVFITANATSLSVFLIGLSLWGAANGMDETFYNGLICDFLESDDRTFFLSVSNSFNAGSVMIGSIFTGYLLEIMSPKAVMLIATSMLGIGWLILLFFCPNVKPAAKRYKFDVRGALFTMMAIAALCSFLTLGGKNIAWLSLPSMFILLLAALSVIALFRTEKGQEKPIIDFSLFKIQCFLPVIMVMALNKLQGPITTYAMIYANLVLKYSAIEMGYTQILTLIPVIVSPIIGKWLVRTKKFKVSFLISGVLLCAQGFAMTFLITPDTSYVMFLLLRGIGSLATVFVMGPSIAYLSRICSKDKYGACLGLYTTITYLANSIMNALGGMVYNLYQTNVALAFPKIALLCGILAIASIFISTMFIKNPAE